MIVDIILGVFVMRFMLVSMVLLFLLCCWLARPWSGDNQAANSNHRGEATSVGKSVGCAAIELDGRFNWGQVGSDADLEACLSSVAMSLETPEALAVWLVEQGFATPKIYEADLASGKMVGAFWPKAGNPSLYPYDGLVVRLRSRMVKLFGQFGLSIPLLLPKNYLVTVVFNADGTVLTDAGALYL